MKINNLDCDVVGKPIRILDYEICPSKKRKDSTYLKMQILLEGKKRFFFYWWQVSTESIMPDRP